MKGGSKMYKRLLAVLIALFFLCQVKVAQAEGLKIGYVLKLDVFNNYEKTKDLESQLNKKAEKKQGENDEKIKAINKLKEEMNLLNEQGKLAKQKEMEEKLRQLKEFQQQAAMEIGKERDGMRIAIIDEIDNVIKEYAEKNGYDLILEGGMLNYRSAKLDLTQEILKTLNSRYKK
jgi:outer membrane protein